MLKKKSHLLLFCKKNIWPQLKTTQHCAGYQPSAEANRIWCVADWSNFKWKPSNCCWEGRMQVEMLREHCQNQPTQYKAAQYKTQYKTQYKAASREQTTMFHFCTICPLPPPLVTWLSKKQSGCWPRLHWARRTGREGGAQPIGSAGWRQVVMMQSCEERPLLPTIPTSGARLGISVVDILLLDRKRNCPANEKTGKRF